MTKEMAMWCILALLALTACSQAQQAELAHPDWPRPGGNVALGKPYTLQPNPTYALCRDAGDATQLTDGVYSEGYFWTQMTTVGWGGTRQIIISLDLGADEPICGLSYNTAAGVAGVTWPGEILVLVSDDGESWYPVDDLVTLSNRREEPPAEGYHDHRFWTDELKAHGRYVGLVLFPGGPYTFCDELEVYRGPAELLQAERRGRPLKDLPNAVGQVLLRRDISLDIRSVRGRLDGFALTEEQRRPLDAELDAAEEQLNDLPLVADEAFRATLPLGPAQVRAWRVLAAAWRQAGWPPLHVWSSNRWAPLKPNDTPPLHDPPPELDLLLMRGEIRSAALNLTNASDAPLTVKLRIDGLPGAPRPVWLQVRDAAWTVSRDVGYVASALPDATPVADGWTVTVPSGMTGQVWLTIDAGKLEPGSYQGKVVLEAPGADPTAVPLQVRVSGVAMPEQLSLALGGWDYTDAPGRGVTADNLDALVSFLRSYDLDSPWATGRVMPFGQYDNTGAQTTPPDVSAMDTWLDRWPGARYYCVFNAFGNAVPDDPAAQRRVGEWIDFWAEHLQEKGIEPSQLVLLLVDETRSEEQDQQIASYARIIHQRQPEVQVFNDPIWVEPADISPEVLELSGILCPNRVHWMAKRQAYEDVYLPQREAGRNLAFYSCSGPARALDPYSYYRLQAWDCFRYGAVMEAFWAFCDTGGGWSWNEYTVPGRVFAPQFLGPDGCVTSKNMEAIREGRYDFEVLHLLRQRLEAGDLPAAAADRARQLLREGVDQVLDAPGEESIMWLDEKDRSRADDVRREAIELLEQHA